MKIYTKIRIDISTWETLEEESHEYDGPLALCWGDPGEADEGGNYGHGPVGESDDFDYGWTDYESDAYGIGRSRGSVGDDPSVPGGGWDAVGYSQYSWGTPFEDQPDLMRNWAGEIMSRVGAAFTALTGVVLTQGKIDPLLAYDLAQDWLYERMGGKWVSRSQYAGVTFDSYEGAGTGEGEGFSEQTVIKEIIRAQQINILNNARRSITDQQKRQQQQPVFSQVTEGSKWEGESEPIEDKTFSITPMSQYSVFNFPPPVAFNMYSQPKTSIWYT